MMKNEDKKPRPKKGKMLTPSERERMMSAIIRNPAVFDHAREELTPEKFNETEAIYQIAWNVVLAHHEEFGSLPERDLLMAELQALAEQDDELLTTTEWADLEAWVDEAFDPDVKPAYDSEKYAPVGCKLLRRFLEERLALELKLSVASQDRVVRDLPSLLTDMQSQADRIQQIGFVDDGLPFPEGWEQETGIETFSTGIACLDHFLDGGHAGGECYGFLGPFGSCKTTVGVMLAVQACAMAARMTAASNYDGIKRLAFVVPYESPPGELRMRSLGCAAQVPRKSLKSLKQFGLAGLSDSQHLQDYEKKLFKKSIAANEPVEGEQERAKRCIKLLNEHLRFVDMTGHGKGATRGAGRGGVSEISRRIAHQLRREPVPSKPIVIVVDYVGVMAKNYQAAKEKDDSALRHFITNAGLESKHMLAAEYDAPCWLLHQLNGKANEKAPAGRLGHTDAAESKSFGENLDAAIVTGTQTQDGLCLFRLTKHRRTAAIPNRIVKVIGQFNRITDVTGKYTVYNNTIEKVADVKGVSTDSGVAAKATGAKGKKKSAVKTASKNQVGGSEDADQGIS
jgi:hypothetical protein